jgi:hypothetical protein
VKSRTVKSTLAVASLAEQAFRAFTARLLAEIAGASNLTNRYMHLKPRVAEHCFLPMLGVERRLFRCLQPNSGMNHQFHVSFFGRLALVSSISSYKI